MLMTIYAPSGSLKDPLRCQDIEFAGTLTVLFPTSIGPHNNGCGVICIHVILDGRDTVFHRYGSVCVNVNNRDLRAFTLKRLKLRLLTTMTQNDSRIT